MLKVDMLTLKGGGESMAGKGLGPLLTVEDVGVCNSATLPRPAGLNVEGVELWQGQDNLGFSSQAFDSVALLLKVWMSAVQSICQANCRC